MTVLEREAAELLRGVTVTTCSSCGEAIVWAITGAGAAMPVEPDPDEHGELELERWGAQLVARVVKPTPVVDDGQLGLELGDVDVVVVDLPPRFRSHWDRCPNADRHRRP